jgi:dipeptidase E
MEDIAFPDSFRRPILVLPDGSYVLCEDGREEVRGPAWLLKDGVMTPVG